MALIRRRRRLASRLDADPRASKRRRLAAGEDFGLTRRKLVDALMDGAFAVGNTASRSLLDDADARALVTRRAPGPARLLWVGVGDVRNVLATLASARRRSGGGAELALELLLNDTSPFVLARGLALLALAADDAAAATAVWSDARHTWQPSG